MDEMFGRFVAMPTIVEMFDDVLQCYVAFDSIYSSGAIWLKSCVTKKQSIKVVG